MPPSPRSAVLFDLDGTLTDTMPFILESVRHTFEGRPRCPSDADWVAGVGTPLRVQLAEWAEGPDDLEALVERYRAHQREHYRRLTRAYPGAVEAVRRLHGRGHPIGVVTGKTVEGAARALALIGLAPLVGAVVGADSCPKHKPDPEPVRLALRTLGTGREGAVFVGDSPLDVRAARAAGVTSVGALWGACAPDDLRAASPDHALATIEELPPLVERLCP